MLASNYIQQDKVCEARIKRKFVRFSFNNKDQISTTEILHWLHLDLFGPINIQSLDGAKYCLVVVDAYSKFIKVLFLTNKIGHFKCFQKLSKMVENENYLHIKAIRSNHCGEFKNMFSDHFCCEEGIPYELFFS